MPETDLQQTAAQIRKSTASYEYFFDNLDDPAWLRSLAAMKFFREPPGPERSEDWVRYPGWPESRYLGRVAARAPDEVLTLARKIPPTDNPRVHQNLFEIAAQLPGAMAAELARKEVKWLRGYSGHLVGIPSAAVPLLAHLAGEAQTKAAFDLASALLAVVPNNGRAGSREAATSRLSEYEYARVVKDAWPSLIETDPRRALNFLCDRLRDMMQAGDGQQGDVDLTSFWRHAVENHEQNLGQGFLDTLVDAVRDCSLAVLQTPDGWQLATSVLRQRPGSIFQRIVLHLLRVQGPPDEITAALSDHKLAYDINVWHEYGELLRDRFAHLTSEQKEGVLTTIARGPELEMTSWREERGDTTEGLRRMERHSQLQRYVVVAEQLPKEHREVYEVLREEFGEPEHPTFLAYTSSWSGPTSPYTEADLAELDPRQVVEKLREWIPDPDGQMLSPEGLGRELQKSVAARAAEFSGIANEFVGLDATYVRALLAGLAQTARAEQPFDWKPVIELCEWVLQQQQPHSHEIDVSRTRDPHWGWARKQVASLLSQGFARGDGEAPHSERETIWRLLTVLADDPDPRPEQEQRHNGEGMDPATLSINTTRGEAIHAVIRYILWVERSLDEMAETAKIEFAVEAKNVLERHLDPAVDSSLAIRSIYGQWFPQFVRLDEDWSRLLAPRVFPTTPELSAQFDAAWNTYVRFNQPYTDVFGVLRDVYAYAVQKTGQESDSSSRPDSPSEHLAHHLFTYRVLGATAEDEDLFAIFWRAAGTELRKQVITRAGWSLERSLDLDPEIGKRFVATWEWIFEETSTSDPSALAGFGAWVGATALDDDWLLKQALAVLELDVHLDPDFVIYKALPRLTPEHPREAVEVLRRMVLTDSEGWSLHGSTDETREALRLVLSTDDADTRKDAEELVHLLGARGMTEFRDLVSQR